MCYTVCIPSSGIFLLSFAVGVCIIPVFTREASFVVRNAVSKIVSAAPSVRSSGADAPGLTSQPIFTFFLFDRAFIDLKTKYFFEEFFSRKFEKKIEDLRKKIEKCFFLNSKTNMAGMDSPSDPVLVTG